MRELPDWLDGWLQFMDNSEPPILYHKWTAVSMIAACLQRKCYMLWESYIFPNMYIVLVGPSGARKGTALSPALDMLRTIGVPLAAESITREAMIQVLEESTNTFEDPIRNILIEHSSVTIFSPELAVFLGQNNPQLISDLTDWFDCRSPWLYRTKNSGSNTVPAVFVNLIGATTPALLQSILPRDAIGGGLTSRIIFVYGARIAKVVVLPIRTPEEEELHAQLLKDLEVILTMKGEFKFSKDAFDSYVEWYHYQCEYPAIDDYNFEPYLARRSLHLRKMCMIMSASRGDDMVISQQDFDRATSLLVETEAVMPRVFSAYGRNDMAEFMPRIMGLISSRSSIQFSHLYSHFMKDMSVEEMRDVLRSLKHIGFLDYGRDEDSGQVTVWRIGNDNEHWN